MSQNETFLSDKKLMSIGEVAQSIGITRKIILNYETKGLITPDQKDGPTGNRYFSADTITQIRTIRILQNLGLSLDEIHDYFSGNTDLSPLIARLEKLRDELSLNIEKLKERAKGDNDFEIRTVTLPAQTIYRKTLQTESIADKTVILREVFISAMKRFGSDTSKRMFFIEYPLEDLNQTSYCIAVPPSSQGEDIVHLPEEKALCIFYHGSYENLAEVRRKILSYAMENGIETKGFCRHLYLEGPPQHTDPAKFITQVAVIIKE